MSKQNLGLLSISDGLVFEEDLVHGRSLPKPERKTALTFQECITAAHLHYVQGIDQHVIAFAMGVNSGRVNEACRAIRRAIIRHAVEEVADDRTDR